MRTLRLVGLSSDGRHVVFVDEAGSEYSAPADERLRAALRQDRARIGQLEIDMDSALRPRDIQARIRRGETPEEVAAAAQVPVEKIMGYAVPVLAERQHVAETAQRCPVRRSGSDGTVRRLDEMVRERLRGRRISMESLAWDAWRRDDNRWNLELVYQSGERTRTAMFVFDALGRYSLAGDDEAKWLTGEKQRTRKGPQPRPPSSASRPADQGADDDLLSLAGGPDYAFDEEYTDDLTAVVRAVSDGDEDTDADDGTGQLAEPVPIKSVRPAAPADEDESAADSTDGTEDDAGSARADVTSEPVRKRRGRASVPSWDEIMFGKTENDS